MAVQTAGDTIHTLCTSNGSPYLNIQTRIMCAPSAAHPLPPLPPFPPPTPLPSTQIAGYHWVYTQVYIVQVVSPAFKFLIQPDQSHLARVCAFSSTAFGYKVPHSSRGVSCAYLSDSVLTMKSALQTRIPHPHSMADVQYILWSSLARPWVICDAACQIIASTLLHNIVRLALGRGYE
jgi:hypothetical protein